MNKFWIVTRDLHVLSATKRHASEQEAIEEAERLCRKEGETFFVFALVGAVKTAAPPVEWVPAWEPEPSATATEDASRADRVVFRASAQMPF